MRPFGMESNLFFSIELDFRYGSQVYGIYIICNVNRCAGVQCIILFGLNSNVIYFSFVVILENEWIVYDENIPLVLFPQYSCSMCPIGFDNDFCDRLIAWEADVVCMRKNPFSRIVRAKLQVSVRGPFSH